MSGLTSAQLADLEHELRFELRRLEAATPAAVGEASGEVERRLDLFVEPGAAPSERERQEALRREGIEEALRRLHEGRYGSCTLCGDGIPYGRLLVMPEATRCVSCVARA
jgi:DnaK suppressor protein